MRVSSTPMDAVTLRQDHSAMLIAAWKKRRDRRFSDKRDRVLDADSD